MIQECELLKTNFTITKSDQRFYEKVLDSSDFAPKLSPAARAMLRMSWRNDRTFFKRLCSSTGKEMISIHPAETEYPVFHPDEWWSDNWHAQSYGRDLDFNRPFFEQWYELFNTVPKKGIDLVNCENCYYCNYCGDGKNCYLDIAGEGNEDCFYNLFTKSSNDCADCTFVYNSELVYESINCYNCHSILYGFYLENCIDCAFSFDLKGCSHCLFSSNLRHKKYYIHNKKVSKEQYEKVLKSLNLRSENNLEKARVQWLSVIERALHKNMWILNSENCFGNDIHNSKNCQFSFNISNCEDCKYLYDVLDAKDCQDLNYSLYNPELSYELISTLNMRGSAFCMASHYCKSAFYSEQCESSNDIFGCIGLKKSQYCILNKQYSKKEYTVLVKQLVTHMKETGEWGRFFPSKYSPWNYNETVAHEHYPLDEQEASAFGFNVSKRRGEVPNSNGGQVKSSTTKQCRVTNRAFKITTQEARLYEKLGVAGPSICPDQRHLNRMALKPPRDLFPNTCSQTGEKLISCYPSDQKMKVVSEKAYLKSVY